MLIRAKLSLQGSLRGLRNLNDLGSTKVVGIQLVDFRWLLDNALVFFQQAGSKGHMNASQMFSVQYSSFNKAEHTA